MSSYYDLSSQFDRYDIKLSKYISPSISSAPVISIAPPSYSQVILEKLQTQQQATAIITTWERKLKELQNSVEDAKKQMHQVQEIMQDIQYRCIRLECKNEYLLEHLKQTSDLAFSLSNSTHDGNNEKLRTEDSLSRMNISVETLIEEAQKSLTSHFSLKADSIRLRRTRSNPCFTEINYTENKRKSSHHGQQINISNNTNNDGDTVIDLKNKKYQKARYFHSQWKLVITMKQLLESVQHTIDAKQGTKVIQQQQRKKVKQASTIATLPSPSSLVEGMIDLEEPTINPEKPTAHIHIHHHHHHHHIHHHLSSDFDTPSLSPSKQPSLQTTNENNDNSSNNDNNNNNNHSFLNKIKLQTSITAKNATTSLLQYVGIMPPENKMTPPLQIALVNKSNSDNKDNDNRPVKYRTMFLATIMIMQTFVRGPNHFPRRRSVWASRGNGVIKRWYQHPNFKKLFPIWLKKAHLVYYLACCFKIK